MGLFKKMKLVTMGIQWEVMVVMHHVRWKLVSRVLKTVASTVMVVTVTHVVLRTLVPTMQLLILATHVIARTVCMTTSEHA
jgi:hypothetical protein